MLHRRRVVILRRQQAGRTLGGINLRSLRRLCYRELVMAVPVFEDVPPEPRRTACPWYGQQFFADGGPYWESGQRVYISGGGQSKPQRSRGSESSRQRYWIHIQRSSILRTKT